MRIILVAFFLLSIPPILHSSTIRIPSNYSTIQEGINAANHGDIIIVAPGTYHENIDFKGKNLIIKSDVDASATIIEGNQTDSVVTFQNNETSDAILDGFTITNGTGKVSGTCGGGVYCFNASPSIINNIITGNLVKPDMILYEYGYGGGIYCKGNSSPIISNNNISYNSALSQGNGAGIYCGSGSNPLISNNVITYNNCRDEYYHLSNGGGGVCLQNSTGTVKNNLITSNTLYGGKGGGVFCNSGNYTLVENTIIENQSGLAIEFGDCVIRNCIISNNTGSGITIDWADNIHISSVTISGNTYGGIRISDGSATSVNSIIYNNSPNEITIKKYIMPASSFDVSFTDIKGGKTGIDLGSGCSLTWGNGMLDANPLFVDSAIGDFHLTHPSPCINVGDNAEVIDLYDIEGDTRITNNTVDLGADEFHRHLYWTGHAQQGLAIDLKLIGTPGSTNTMLWLGSNTLDPPVHLNHYGDWHLGFPILFEAILGSIPGPDGILKLPITIPFSLPLPCDLPLQALINAKLTNHCVISILE